MQNYNTGSAIQQQNAANEVVINTANTQPPYWLSVYEDSFNKATVDEYRNSLGDFEEKYKVNFFSNLECPYSEVTFLIEGNKFAEFLLSQQQEYDVELRYNDSTGTIDFFNGENHKFKFFSFCSPTGWSTEVTVSFGKFCSTRAFSRYDYSFFLSDLSYLSLTSQLEKFRPQILSVKGRVKIALPESIQKPVNEIIGSIISVSDQFNQSYNNYFLTKSKGREIKISGKKFVKYGIQRRALFFEGKMNQEDLKNLNIKTLADLANVAYMNSFKQKILNVFETIHLDELDVKGQLRTPFDQEILGNIHYRSHWSKLKEKDLVTYSKAKARHEAITRQMSAEPLKKIIVKLLREKRG